MEIFHVIPYQTYDAFTNMAIDEMLLFQGTPTIRFYTWQPSAVSIGYFQSVNEEVNLLECERQGVDVVRRITGGGAVYHDHYGELTYSFICPHNMVPQNIMESYRLICSAIAEGLGTLGIAAQHAGINDIVVNGKKISGSAQTRRQGIVLQHGTILLRVNVEKMFSLLNVCAEKISDKQISSVKERVTSIEKEIKHFTRDEVRNAILKGFSCCLNLSFIDRKLDDLEMLQVEKLRNKYESKEWIFKR